MRSVLHVLEPRPIHGAVQSRRELAGSPADVGRIVAAVDDRADDRPGPPVTVLLRALADVGVEIELLAGEHDRSIDLIGDAVDVVYPIEVLLFTPSLIL